MRLPKSLGDQVVEQVIELLNPVEEADAWHGGCLCLAELGRRGLLLPTRVSEVVNRLEKAMMYDQFQGNCSRGDYVRDASCYVAWAFARAYEPSILQPYVLQLARNLLAMAVFDREIHCRRAACAAFQENVGRQGNFPHGIEINTKADYWAVGLIHNAYLKVSVSIAKFDDYKHHMIDHLVNHKLQHWELRIRKLAGDALYALTELDPAYMRDKILVALVERVESQHLFERHGAIYGIGKILHRLYELKVPLIPSDETMDKEVYVKNIRNLVTTIEKSRGYRGRGGEYVREATCLLIEAIASTKFELNDKIIDRYQQEIDENLRIAQDFVQEAAAKALRAMSQVYYSRVENQPQRIQNITLKWCDQLDKEIIASVTRGYAKGLGCLAKPLLLPCLTTVVDVLIRKSLLTKNAETRDYLTRQMCVLALVDIVETIGVDNYSYSWKESEDNKDTKEDDELAALGIEDVVKQPTNKNANIITEDEKFQFQFDRSEVSSSLLYDRILSAILQRFEDYEVDKRGDVGSFIRENALMPMAKVILELHRATIESKTNYVWLRPSMTEAFLNAVLRQLAEKLDRVRRAAGMVIEYLFCTDNELVLSLRFPHDVELRRIFADCKKLDWSNGAVVYPYLVQILSLEAYRRSIFEGLLQSMGALSSSTIQMCLNAVTPYLHKLQEAIEEKRHEQAVAAQIEALASDILYCCKKRYHNPLFMVPFLKAIGTLLTTGDYFSVLKKSKYTFPNDLAKQLKSECYNSDDINKLMASVQVWIGLTIFPQSREFALQRLLIYLGYKYPALRKETANRLYGALQTWPEIAGENTDAVLDFLQTHTWSGSDVERIRDERNQLFTLLQIKSPIPNNLATNTKE